MAIYIVKRGSDDGYNQTSSTLLVLFLLHILLSYSTTAIPFAFNIIRQLQLIHQTSNNNNNSDNWNTPRIAQSRATYLATRFQLQLKVPKTTNKGTQHLPPILLLLLCMEHSSTNSNDKVQQAVYLCLTYRAKQTLNIWWKLIFKIRRRTSKRISTIYRFLSSILTATFTSELLRFISFLFPYFAAHISISLYK